MQTQMARGDFARGARLPQSRLVKEPTPRAANPLPGRGRPSAQPSWPSRRPAPPTRPAARRSEAIAALWADSFGCAATTVTSQLTTCMPRALASRRASETKTGCRCRPSEDRCRGSARRFPGGQDARMASVRAWRTASPSLWPVRPGEPLILTPPSRAPCRIETVTVESQTDACMASDYRPRRSRQGPDQERDQAPATGDIKKDCHGSLQSIIPPLGERAVGRGEPGRRA